MLVNKKRVTWCEDDDELFKREENLFGPPLFDEKSSHYKLRHFKNAFIWGKFSKVCF